MGRRREVVHRHRVGGFAVIVVRAQVAEGFLRRGVAADQGAGGVGVGLNLMEAIALQPLRVNALHQPRHAALGPQKLPLLVVDQRHGRTLQIQVFRQLNTKALVIPL